MTASVVHICDTAICDECGHHRVLKHFVCCIDDDEDALPYELSLCDPCAVELRECGNVLDAKPKVRWWAPWSKEARARIGES